MNDLLKVVAPTIATVLGGPLAGLAVEAIGGVFGWTDATKEKVAETLQGPMSGEQIAAIKQAEINLKLRLKELDIKVEELEVKKVEIAVDDRKSARQLWLSKASNLIGWIAVMTISGFFGMIYLVLYKKVLFGMDPEELVIVGTIIGYLAAYTQQIYNFLFGSSAGSDKKNEGLMAAIQKLGNGNGNYTNGTKEPPSS